MRGGIGGVGGLLQRFGSIRGVRHHKGGAQDPGSRHHRQRGDDGAHARASRMPVLFEARDLLDGFGRSAWFHEFT